MHLHYIWLVMLHIRAICFEHRDVVTCERHVVIFLKTAKGVMFDINFTFCIIINIYIIYLVKSYNYTMIFILVYIC